MLSAHADQEAADEDIDVAEICEALLNGEVLEQYEDTGRGPSCLILGFARDKPIYVVCGWRRDWVVVITVYIPQPPKAELCCSLHFSLGSVIILRTRKGKPRRSDPARGTTPARGGRQGIHIIPQLPVPHKGWAICFSIVAIVHNDSQRLRFVWFNIHRTA